MTIVDMFDTQEETQKQADSITELLNLCRQTAESDSYNVYETIMALPDENACKFFCIQDFNTIRTMLKNNPRVVMEWNSRPTLEALYVISDDRTVRSFIRQYMQEIGIWDEESFLTANTKPMDVFCFAD